MKGRYVVPSDGAPDHGGRPGQRPAIGSRVLAVAVALMAAGRPLDDAPPATATAAGAILGEAVGTPA